MTERTAIERAIGVLLKPLGFNRTRETWHRSTSETVLVLNVQKSEWGPTLYLNLGVYLRGLEAETAPPEFRCHIRTRLDSLVGNRGPLLEALDLESVLPDIDRQQRILDAIVQSGLPWLEARETETKARSAILGEKVRTGLVQVAAKKHLGIDDRQA